MEKLTKLINKETISYLFFGVLTTLVNLVTYKVCSLFLSYVTSTVIAWIISVLFAYITNKLFVFNSRNFEFKYLCKEFTAFVTARLLSGAFDLGFMVFAVELLHMDDFIAKILTNVVVVIVNYFASKLLIFKNK